MLPARGASQWFQRCWSQTTSEGDRGSCMISPHHPVVQQAASKQAINQASNDSPKPPGRKLGHDKIRDPPFWRKSMAKQKYLGFCSDGFTLLCVTLLRSEPRHAHPFLPRKSRCIIMGLRSQEPYLSWMLRP